MYINIARPRILLVYDEQNIIAHTFVCLQYGSQLYSTCLHATYRGDVGHLDRLEHKLWHLLDL